MLARYPWSSLGVKDRISTPKDVSSILRAHLLTLFLFSKGKSSENSRNVFQHAGRYPALRFVTMYQAFQMREILISGTIGLDFLIGRIIPVLGFLCCEGPRGVNVNVTSNVIKLFIK
jgi:hypothetical protein